MNKTPDRQLVSLVLDEIEEELRSLGLWQDESSRPAPEAFSSTIPFCLDTMQFHEWLQFIFIPKMKDVLEKEGVLPDRVLIHTMAEEIYRGKWARFRKLIVALKKLDELF